MSGLGAHSEVGTLRKVMVHRPELSVRRLTPDTHDALLFPDVLWVELAQHARDESCWIYGGVSISPMHWSARRREAYNVSVIYRAHPMFRDANFEYWYPPLGDDGQLSPIDFGLASLEGGDVMPIGGGNVLIGM